MLYYLKLFLILYFVLTMSLALAGNVSKTCRFIARILVAYILLIIVSAYGVVASILLNLIGKVGLAQWTTARAFKYTLAPALGLKFEIENEEQLGSVRPAIFLSNHQAELDVLLLGILFPKYCSVSAKKSLKYIPFLGWYMSLSGTVFIDRGNRQSALSTFDTAAQYITKNRQSVWIFPEGTRSYSSQPTMLPFKKGAFHLAIKAQVPIVPVVIQNYSHVLHVPTRTFEAGTIKVKVLEAIETKGMTGEKAEVDELVKRVEAMMTKELVTLGLGANKAVGLESAIGAAQKKLD